MEIDAQQAQAIIAIVNAVSLGVVAIIHAYRGYKNGNGVPKPPPTPVEIIPIVPGTEPPGVKH